MSKGPKDNNPMTGGKGVTTTSTGALPPRLLTLRTESILTRMALNYGHRWPLSTASSQLYDMAVAEWADATADFSDEEIQRGIRAMRDECPEWPPTIGEFRALCRPQKPAEPEHHYPPLAPPLPVLTEAQEAERRERLKANAARLRELRLTILDGGRGSK